MSENANPNAEEMIEDLKQAYHNYYTKYHPSAMDIVHFPGANWNTPEAQEAWKAVTEGNAKLLDYILQTLEMVRDAESDN